MLADLLLWIELHSADLDDYLLRYPYLQYRQIDHINLFKGKLNSIIDFIAAIIIQKEPKTHPKREYSYG